jgi:hypothetical protein
MNFENLKFIDGCVNNEGDFGILISEKMGKERLKILLKKTKRYNDKRNNIVRIYNLRECRSKLGSSLLT